MLRRSHLSIIAGLATASLAAILVVTPPAIGAESGRGAIAQGFEADNGNGAIVASALVSSKAGATHRVELATSQSASRLVGVAEDNPLVTISGADQEVAVVIGGTASIWVSDINGPVREGDKITASPIAGVGMLATADSQIVGTARATFETGRGQTRSVADQAGRSHSVHIGRIPVQIGVAYYQAPGSNFLPPFVQDLANNLAGRPVSLIRILFSGVLLLTGFISVAMLIYSTVRSAMISLGRNPLAAGAIRKGLYQMAAVTLVVLAGALLASYLVLVV